MKNKNLLSIFFVVAIDLIGFGLIVPILPYYAASYGASALTLGLLMMCYSGMQFFFSPFWGGLSDRIGRKPVLIICLSGLGISFVILGLAPSLAWLFIARIFGGFFGANISVATAYIADVTTPETRARGMGLVGAAFGIGFLVGPALGGALSRWGYGWPAFIAAALVVCNLVYTSLKLQEPLTHKNAEGSRKLPSKEALAYALKNPQTASTISMFFLVTLAMAQLETSFALFLLRRFNLGAYHAGMILALMALVMGGVQGGGIGKLSKRFGESKLVIYGSFIMIGALIGATLSFKVSLFVIFITLYGLGYGLTNPSLLSLTSRFALADNQGVTMGVYQSAGSLGRMLGPPLAGFLFDSLGITVPFFGASILLSFVFCLALIRRPLWK